MHIKQINAVTDCCGLTPDDKLTQFSSWFVRRNNWKLLYADNNEETFEITLPKQTITPGSKIYFSKMCSFPSLLLGRLQKEHPEIKLKRVVKREEADFIVYDRPPCIEPSPFLITDEMDFDGVEKLFQRGRIAQRAMEEFRKWHKNSPDAKFAFNVNDFHNVFNHQAYIEEEMGMPMHRVLLVQKPEEILSCFQDRDKLLATADLVQYIYGFIPPATKEEVLGILSYMKTNDGTTREMAINSLQYVNLSGVLYPVLKWLNENIKEFEMGNTAAWKYLYFVLHCSPGNICSYQASRRVMIFVANVLNNPLNTTTLDDYKQEILENVKERLRRENGDLMADLERINCDFEIIEKECDEDRETGTSDTEMEGSGSLRNI